MQILVKLIQNIRHHKLHRRVLIAVSIFCVIYNYYAFTESIPIQSTKEVTKGVTDGDKLDSTSKFEIPAVSNKASSMETKEDLSRKEIVVLLHAKTHKNVWYYHKDQTFTSQQCKHLTNSVSTSNVLASDMFSLPCKMTADQKYFNVSDAVLFHSRDLKRDQLPLEYRKENQLWVYLQQESQIYTGQNLKKYSNIFNWTMTHRRDSDVYYPYGYVVQRLPEENSTGLDFSPSTVTNKTGLVAWIVSHCRPKSKRHLFVQELKKYIQVDIFGRCGQRCPSSANVDCYTYVASNYKMYLSFENSLCTDYITEKFFKALSYNMLPIVYGGGRGGAGQDYSAIAPNGSYIDTRSFESPEQLAKYILYLSKNDSEFHKFFEWKKKYQVVLLNDHNRRCSLCQKLYEHLNKVPSPVKWYKDLWSWWNYMDVANETTVEGNEISSSSTLGPQLKFKTPACDTPRF